MCWWYRIIEVVLYSSVVCVLVDLVVALRVMLRSELRLSGYYDDQIGDVMSKQAPKEAV